MHSSERINNPKGAPQKASALSEVPHELSACYAFCGAGARRRWIIYPLRASLWSVCEKNDYCGKRLSLSEIRCVLNEFCV